MSKYTLVASIFVVIGVAMIFVSFAFTGNCVSSGKACYVDNYNGPDPKVDCGQTHSYERSSCIKYQDGSPLFLTLLTFGFFFLIIGIMLGLCFMDIGYSISDDDDDYRSYF